MKPNGVACEWIEYAERDYEAARILSAHAPRSPEIIAFHCQQCAEKYLKAVLAQFGADIPRIHDLAVLNRLAASRVSELAHTEEWCERLTPYGTFTRCPESGLEIGPDQLPLILDWTDRIRQAIHGFFEIARDTGDCAAPGSSL